MKKVVLIALLFSALVCNSQQWSNTGDNVTTGNVAIGSVATNSYSMLTINGPNSPAGVNSKRDINFNFASAGSSTIRSYRGGSWDTYLQFLTTAQDNSKDVRLHIDGVGNIGLGTATPQSKLDIQSQVGNSALRIQGGNPYGTYYFDVSPFLQATPWSVGYSFNVKSSNGSFNNIMSLIDGKVGVGTIQPQQRFHVKNGALMSSDLSFDNINARLDGSSIPALKFTRWIGSGSVQHNAFVGQFYNVAIGEYSFGIGTGHSAIGNQDFNNKVITATLNGNVGIGTTNPTQKLQVKGTVYSTEVKVDLAAGTGPDYVFEPNYDLKPLAEIETYIKENKHLPEVPSAKEMEANGVQLGEMNMLLLKKVEELTLYLIEMKKENNEAKEMNKRLADKIEKLESKMNNKN